MAWAGDEQSFAEFVDRHGLTFPQISDRDGEVFAHFGVPGQPALVVVGTDGEVQQFFGAVDEALIEQALIDAGA